MSIGRALLNVPFPEMVYNLASAIAKSQANLDRESIEILRMMGDKENYPVSLPTLRLNEDRELVEDSIETSMIGAGFQPTFYQFAETIIEVKMTIQMEYTYSEEGEVKRNTTAVRANKGRIDIRSTSVDATYTSKYSFNQEGSSTLRTRLVPVPPNPYMQRILDMKSEAMQMKFELDMRQIELAIEENRKKLEEELVEQ